MKKKCSYKTIYDQNKAWPSRVAVPQGTKKKNLINQTQFISRRKIWYLKQGAHRWKTPQIDLSCGINSKFSITTMFYPIVSKILHFEPLVVVTKSKRNPENI